MDLHLIRNIGALTKSKGLEEAWMLEKAEGQSLVTLMTVEVIYNIIWLKKTPFVVKDTARALRNDLSSNIGNANGGSWGCNTTQTHDPKMYHRKSRCQRKRPTENHNIMIHSTCSTVLQGDAHGKQNRVSWIAPVSEKTEVVSKNNKSGSHQKSGD